MRLWYFTTWVITRKQYKYTYKRVREQITLFEILFLEDPLQQIGGGGVYFKKYNGVFLKLLERNPQPKTEMGYNVYEKKIGGNFKINRGMYFRKFRVIANKNRGGGGICPPRTLLIHLLTYISYYDRI